MDIPENRNSLACNELRRANIERNLWDTILAASHHKAVHIDTSGSVPQTTDAPRLYDTDADLERVAAAIGFKIDWNVVDH